MCGNVMRRSETTNISNPIEIKTATLTSCARTDRLGSRHSLLVERGRSVRLATEVRGEAEIKGPRDAIFTG